MLASPMMQNKFVKGFILNVSSELSREVLIFMVTVPRLSPPSHLCEDFLPD